MFEPVAKGLQAINTDIYSARNQVNSFVSVISLHSENADEVFGTDIFPKVEKFSAELQLELTQHPMNDFSTNLWDKH